MSKPIEFPSEVRASLLAQHARLRTTLSVIDRLMGEILSGRRLATVLETAITNLRDELHMHQDAEERALEAALPAGDPRGPAHAAQMLRDHVAEHAELAAGLTDAWAEGLARAWPRIAGQLRKHLDDEERTFLHE